MNVCPRQTVSRKAAAADCSGRILVAADSIWRILPEHHRTNRKEVSAHEHRTRSKAPDRTKHSPRFLLRTEHSESFCSGCHCRNFSPRSLLRSNSRKRYFRTGWPTVLRCDPAQGQRPDWTAIGSCRGRIALQGRRSSQRPPHHR